MKESVEPFKRKDAWAVITGASDGIGAEYAIELARHGYNIMLVSRTEVKLRKVQKDIKEELLLNNLPMVKIKIIVTNFSGNCRRGFYETLTNLILAELESMDVSMVIINAGVMTSGKYSEMSLKQIQDMLDCNIY